MSFKKSPMLKWVPLTKIYKNPLLDPWKKINQNPSLGRTQQFFKTGH